MQTIADAYVDACRLELDALKPGNVHRHAEGYGMTCADFEISAEVSAPEVARDGERIGVRIRNAVMATRAAVRQNTNLGIILLCVPLAVAAEYGEPIARFLDTLDVEDAQQVFLAIAAANPGGLGAATQHDVRVPATAPLRAVMASAVERDLIARQYSNGFADIACLGLSTWRIAKASGATNADAATDVYLQFLKTLPDTHIARKFGRQVAENVQKEAQERVLALPALQPERHAFLLEWDSDLKARGLNPGACADLTVATVLAGFLTERLSNALQLFPKSD